MAIICLLLIWWPKKLFAYAYMVSIFLYDCQDAANQLTIWIVVYCACAHLFARNSIAV